MSETQEDATFVKVAEHLFRNESSGAYYARAKRGGKRFHATLRVESGEGIRDQALAKRDLRKWLDDLIASLSEEELLEFARQKAAALIQTEPDAPKPVFFIKTKRGEINLKVAPIIEVVVSGRRI